MVDIARQLYLVQDGKLEPADCLLDVKPHLISKVF